MDPVTIAILTVIANAVVIGIIVYAIQKRIESSYSQKLEELRASLQLSNFEQQTKFARLHEKRVEVLEKLYRDFLKFTSVFHAIVDDAFVPVTRGIRVERDEAGIVSRTQFRDAKRILDDWGELLVGNRLFLPESAAKDLELTEHRAFNALRLLRTLTLRDGDIAVMSDEFLTPILTIFGLGFESTDWLSRPENHLAALQLALDFETRNLERLYRSLADVKSPDV